MKVCDLTQSYAPTGGGVRTYIHAKRDHILEHRPEDEHLLIVPGPEDSVRREGRSTVYTVASPLVPGSQVYRLFLRSDKVLRILRTEHPEVVEVHCAYNLPWTALYYRRGHPAARVVGCYMTDVPQAYVAPAATRLLGGRVGRGAASLADGYVRRLYSRCDATMAISPALATRLREIGVENVECVPLGVDLETFHPPRRHPVVRARLGVAADERLLIYAGRLDDEKRAALVVDAFQQLPESFRGRLALVGDGPLREELERRAERDGRIHVLPFEQDRRRFATLLASADLYVSGMPFETFGLSVIEAQACGLPVVGVASGAMLDRVPEGSGVGRLGPVDSAEAMAANILALAPEEGRREAGRRARALAEAEFSWQTTFGRVFALYHRLLGVAPEPTTAG
jgi:alpha-1,6-mannosyltransferase